MKQLSNPFFELYEFSQEEHDRIRGLLADPLLQAYVRSIISKEAMQFFTADLYEEYSPAVGIEASSTKILVDNAFNRGCMAVAKQLIIIDPTV